MTQASFNDLGLKYGDYIWLMNEGGEGFFGYFYGDYDQVKMTFKFRNHSNGQDEIVKIEKLQRLERAK